MKLGSILLGVVLNLLVSSVYAQLLCPKYTEEQLGRIQAAYDYGSGFGYELTLPAIVVNESFVEDKIVRYNPADPSTGITQIQFDTLRHLSGLSHWEAIEEASRLLSDDELSFFYSVAKLNSIKSDSYWYKWKRYNGSGPTAVLYANRISRITKELQFCLNLQPIR